MLNLALWMPFEKLMETIIDEDIFLRNLIKLVEH